MNCRYCLKPIKKPGDYWVHIPTRLYSCGADRGTLAEPDLRVNAVLEEEKE